MTQLSPRPQLWWREISHISLSPAWPQACSPSSVLLLGFLRAGVPSWGWGRLGCLSGPSRRATSPWRRVATCRGSPAWPTLGQTPWGHEACGVGAVACSRICWEAWLFFSSIWGGREEALCYRGGD